MHKFSHIYYESSTLLRWQNDVDLSKIEYDQTRSHCSKIIAEQHLLKSIRSASLSKRKGGLVCWWLISHLVCTELSDRFRFQCFPFLGGFSLRLDEWFEQKSPFVSPAAPTWGLLSISSNTPKETIGDNERKAVSRWSFLHTTDNHPNLNNLCLPS